MFFLTSAGISLSRSFTLRFLPPPKLRKSGPILCIPWCKHRKTLRHILRATDRIRAESLGCRLRPWLGTSILTNTGFVISCWYWNTRTQSSLSRDELNSKSSWRANPVRNRTWTSASPLCDDPWLWYNSSCFETVRNISGQDRRRPQSCWDVYLLL